MKSIPLSIAVVALLTAILPAHAQRRPSAEGAAPAPLAIGDPLQLLYRVSGVRDNGAGDEAGIATSFHCSSSSTVDERVRIVVRNFDGTQAGARGFTIQPTRTVTMSTHFTRIFFEDVALSRGVNINQGSAEILATSVDVFCSAMIVDASTNTPQGIDLHLVRHNAIAGTQE